MVAALINDPVTLALEANLSEPDLRREVAQEIERRMLDYVTRTAELGAGTVTAEISSEHWLTRSWRPMLMVILMGFLVLAGFGLPMADLIAGYRLPFEPRWQVLPAGFWDFLAIGMGGYIGGRSLEKIAGLAGSEFRRAAGSPSGRD
jgi:Holin of 3TMs, for gene-transfer release